MAEDKQMYPVNLYDPNGGFVGTVEHEHDVNADRDRPLTAGGKTYVYQARSDRWVQVGEPHEIKGKPKADQPSQNEPIQMGQPLGEDPVVEERRTPTAKP